MTIMAFAPDFPSGRDIYPGQASAMPCGWSVRGKGMDVLVAVAMKRPWMEGTSEIPGFPSYRSMAVFYGGRNMTLEEIFTIRNLYLAHEKTRRGKLHKNDVIAFELDKAAQISRLRDEIISGRYRVSPYNTFYIHEPKKRRVDATLYRDRVVQNCLVENYLGPLLERRLIYDNAACRKEKGTDFARHRLEGFLHECYRKYGHDFYVLSFDIHHYFESIDHETLKKKVSRIVMEDEIRDFLFMIIDSFNKEEGVGLPLGNQTSQCFALYYLDHMDRVIKERFRMKYYTRYMDDGIILSDDLEKLKRLNGVLHGELSDVRLEMNVKKNHICSIREGLTYLGFTYHLGDTGKLHSRMAGKKRKRLIRYLNGYEVSYVSLDSYYGYLRKRSTGNGTLKLRLRCRMKEIRMNEETERKKKDAHVSCK